MPHEVGVDEALARDFVHGPQNGRIADPAPPQAEQELHAADMLVARRSIGHLKIPAGRAANGLSFGLT